MTFYYLSPYLIIMGAGERTASGSMVVIRRDDPDRARAGPPVLWLVWLPWVTVVVLVTLRAGGIERVDICPHKVIRYEFGKPRPANLVQPEKP